MVDDEAPVEEIVVDVADAAFNGFPDEVERETVFDVIWFGAGDAVLWLDTESGLADSSITISPGDPGESGGMSFVLLAAV